MGETLAHNHGARITALGTVKGLEQDLIPARGVDLRLITPVPIPRKLNLDLAKLPFRLAAAVAQTRAILKDVSADAVFGTGGYVAAPAYLAAKSLGLPFFVLETNALAGIANKLGVKLGGVGLNAQHNSGMSGEVVGIPVRPTISADPDGAKAMTARATWGLREGKPVLLVTGGSQGAMSINTAVGAAVTDPEVDLTRDVQILHAYGKKNEAPASHEDYTPVPYIEDMASALAVADVVVCRSGAMTVAEVSAAGVPAIYVPLPHGNGEQALNCRHIVDAGGALLINDAELSPRGLADAVRDVLAHSERFRAALHTTSAGDVAGVIADKIVAAVRGRGKDN